MVWTQELHSSVEFDSYIRSEEGLKLKIVSSVENLLLINLFDSKS